MHRLSAELGGPMLWVKRDDCSGLATGGNKTRKLEFLLGDALENGADTVVTFGAVQSNHARQTAAACAKLGLPCHLVLTRQVQSSSPRYESGGNVLFDKLFGATLHIVELEHVKSYTQNFLREMQSAGRNLYSIPAGGSNAIGALGYAACAAELQQQISELGSSIRTVVHASSSAGTQAGLLYGIDQLGTDLNVLGINVYHTDPAHLQARIDNLLAAMHEDAAPLQGSPEVLVNHAYFGEGYGQPTRETLQAIRMAAELEGLLFDPVYSGKALAAVIDQVNLGNFTEDVVLIHTGGSAVLDVYAEQFF
jgi:L-cysteate sulfo-lyase